jgi:hypothetical protein
MVSQIAEFKLPDGKPRQRNDFVQKNDRYKWLWFGYNDTIAEEGEIFYSNGKDELQFSFSGGCIVKVTIKKKRVKPFVNYNKLCRWMIKQNNVISLLNVEKFGHFI